MKILVAEDSPMDLLIIQTILEEENYELICVENGAEVLNVLESESTLPDLILLDIMMPEMDGYEACEQIKSNPKTEEIPVIFLTGKRGEENEIKGFELGAVDFINKPYHEKVVKIRVKTQLDLRKHVQEINKQNLELKQAFSEIKTLRDLLPMCAKCRKIRDEQGYWKQIETYIVEHTDSKFSHGLCESCADEMYGDQSWYKGAKTKQANKEES